MRIWDRGTYETHKFDDAKVEVTFHGERLHGRYGLFPLKKRKGEPPGKDWMIHRMDPPEDPDREPMPERLVPMLAKPSPHGLPPDDERWAYEIKWDGVRALAYSEPGRIRFESRNRNDITRLLSRAQGAQPRAELAPRDPRRRDRRLRRERPAELRAPAGPDARRLRERGAAADEGHAGHYVVFDLLWLDGHSLMELPYEERRARLKELELQGAHWQTPDHVVGNGAAVLAASLDARPRGRRRQAARQPVPAGPALAVLAEGQERRPRGRRRRRLAAGRGQAPRADRRAARRRARRRAPALRRPRRHGLHRGRARPPRQGARAARRLAVRRRPQAAARRRLGTAHACRRGRVHRVDVGRDDAPPLLQGAARGGAAVGVPRRRHARPRRRRGQGRRAHAEGHEPRQGALSEGRLHEARRHRVLHGDRAGDPRRTSRRGR